MAKDLYCIIAGSKNRPETIQRGILEKGLGQGTIAGDVVETLNNRGECGIPNYTEAWGVRLIDGQIPKDSVSVTDSSYKGQIKELKWGDPKGCLIICRYLKGYNSIDLQYQDLVLNAKDNIREDSEASADAFFIVFQNGDNFFDPETDPYLVQMLRIHYLNETSKSRSPESQNFMFWEKSYVDAEQKETKTLNTKFECLKIVNEAASDNSLKKLKNLYAIIEPMVVGDKVKDENLYASLQLLADEQPDSFMALIQNYKAEVSTSIDKAKSYNILDLTKDGVIVAGKDKKEIIGEGIPGKKDAMIEWVFNHFLDEKAYEVAYQLKKITDNLK